MNLPPSIRQVVSKKENLRLIVLAIIIIALPLTVFLAQQVARYRSKAAATVQFCLGDYPCSTAPTYTLDTSNPGFTAVVPVSINSTNGNVSSVSFKVRSDKRLVAVSQQPRIYSHFLNSSDPSTARFQLLAWSATTDPTDSNFVITAVAVGLTPLGLQNPISSPFRMVDLFYNVQPAASGTNITTPLSLTALEAYNTLNQSLLDPASTSTATANIIINPTSTSIIPTSGTTSKTGYLFIDPQSTTQPVSFSLPGTIFPAVIKFKTGTSSTSNQKISAISLRITYPYSGTVPQLDVVSATAGTPVNQIYPDPVLVGTGDWAYQVNKVTRSNGQVSIDLGVANTSTAGFSTTTDTPLAVIYFRANNVPSPNPIPLTWSTTETKMLTKAEPIVDILNPLVNASYTIVGEISSPTPTPPPTVTPSPTPPPSTPSLTYGFKMQAVLSANVSRNSTLSILNPTTNLNFAVPVTSNTQGIFSPTSPVSLTGVSVTSSGTTYDAYEKAPGYLKKLLGSINLFPGANTGPSIWNNIVLRAGDFNSTPDNKLDITDIGLILSVYNDLAVPVTTSNSKYDIDANNVINIVDIAQVLTNYTCITVYGDPAPSPLPAGTCNQR